MSCSMLTAMTMRGFRPLFREKMVRLEDRRSVVFSVSAAVPAPQQLQGQQGRTGDMLSELSYNWKRQVNVRAQEKLLDIWSNVVDLGTHLVSDHFTGGSSCICPQNHPILHHME